MNGRRGIPINLRAHLTLMEVNPELRRIIDFMSRRSKMISHDFIRKPTYELTGTYNRSGDAQIELDVLADEFFLDELLNEPTFGIIDYASEEREEVVHVNGTDHKGNAGKYSLTLDPIDGSKQVRVNNTVGTIVGIHEGGLMDGRPGKDSLRAAMYVLYGPRTSLTYAVDGGTFSFVQDGAGEFIASTEDPIRLPQEGKIIMPGGNRALWTRPHRELVEFLEANEYQHRYHGVFVTDVNHLLLGGGGLFSHPRHVNKKDTLRLLYELQPLAFIVSHADGAATDGIVNILDIVPAHPDQRSPIYIGSKYEVCLASEYLEERISILSSSTVPI